MVRKPRIDRSPEEKWQIVQEALKSGNVSETCRRYGIAPNLYYRWKDEASRERRQRLGEKRCRGREREGSPHPPMERTLGRKSLEIEIRKNVVGE